MPKPFSEEFQNRLDNFSRPRKKASFFQEHTEKHTGRNEDEVKAIRSLVQFMQQTLTCTSATYPGRGSRKNFEEGLKQRKNSLRYLICNLILAERACGTIKIPKGSGWWCKRHMEHKTFINSSSMFAVIKELESRGDLDIAAKHHEQSENVTCYVASNQFILNVNKFNPNILKPNILLKNTKREKKRKPEGWTPIHLKDKEKIHRFYLSSHSYKDVFTKKEKEIIQSTWVMQQYETIDKKLIVRIDKQTWNKLLPKQKDYVRTLIYSNCLHVVNPVCLSINIKVNPALHTKATTDKFKDTWSKQPNFVTKETVKKIKKSIVWKTITSGEYTNPEYYEVIPGHITAYEWDALEDEPRLKGMQPEYFEYELDNGSLFRVFNVDEDYGGRYYGATVQRLPKAIRELVVLQTEDGSETKMVEMDYSHLHPTILYCEKGLTPVSNPYGDVTGMNRDERKIALLVMINAENKKKAISAMRQYFLVNMGHLKGDQKLKNKYIEDLFEEIEKINNEIADSFYTGVGSRLQNVDSSIATGVMYDFMNRYPGEVIECLHDSFMVPANRKGILRQLMVKHFQSVVKTSHIPQITMG